MRLVRLVQSERIAPGKIINHADGLAIVAADPRHQEGQWIHSLLFLSGREYSGSKHTAEMALLKARDRYLEHARDEISVPITEVSEP